MAFADEYDFHLLKNEAEQFVLQELERQIVAIEDEEFCRCGDCVLDMAAMAFNSVKPLYRFSLLGSLYAAQAKSEDAYVQSVRDAVRQAIEKVRANPSHD